MEKISLIDQLPNGGAVIAIIVVVVVFLKKLDRTDEALARIVAMFTAETTASRKEYREHVTGIMDQGLTAHRETRDAIRSLHDTINPHGGRPDDGR